jgi:hypothetical protein
MPECEECGSGLEPGDTECGNCGEAVEHSGLERESIVTKQAQPLTEPTLPAPEPAEEPAAEPAAAAARFAGLVPSASKLKTASLFLSSLKAPPSAKAGGAATGTLTDTREQFTSGPQIVLEVNTTEHYRVGELCQLAFRITNVGADYLYARVAIHSPSLSFRETEKTVELEPAARQRVLSFAFSPETPGKAKLGSLSVVVRDASGQVHGYTLPDESVQIPIQGRRGEGEAPGLVVQGGINLTLGEVYGADVANLVNLTSQRDPAQSPEAAVFKLLPLRRDPNLTALEQERISVESAFECPRAPLEVAHPGGNHALEQASLLVGAERNPKRLVLFAGERLRLGRQMPKPGDVEGNHLVLRVPVSADTRNSKSDPNLRISRKHLRLVRRGADLQAHQVGSCETALSGRPMGRGDRWDLPDTFEVVLGSRVATLDGIVVRGVQPVTAGRFSAESPGLSTLPTSGVGSGVEAMHPVLSVRLRPRAPLLDYEYHLVVRTLAIGSSLVCPVEFGGGGVAPVHARILNVRNRLGIQPVVREGLTTVVNGREVTNPKEVILLTAGMKLQLGGVPVEVQALDPAIFRP